MSVATVTRNSLSERDLFFEPDLTGADLHGTHLVLSNLSRAEPAEANLSRADLPSMDLCEAHLHRTDLFEAGLMSAKLDGANAGVAARAGRVSPSATAGHRLQLPVGELAAFSERRGTGKPQVDGLRRLLHRLYLNLCGKPDAQLLLHGRPGVLKQPLAEVLVLKASLYKPALHLLPTRRFAHGCFPFRCLTNRLTLTWVFASGYTRRKGQYPMLARAWQKEGCSTNFRELRYETV